MAAVFQFYFLKNLNIFWRSLNTQTFTILKSVPLVGWPTEEVPIVLLISLNGGLGEGENELSIVMLVDLTNLLRLA